MGDRLTRGSSRHGVVQRQKLVSATALQRPFAVGSVCEKILQRGKQKRTELAFLPIGARVDLVFNQISKKTLGKVLGIVHGVPAAAYESIKWRPIGLAKLSERGTGKLRVSLASSSRENHAPMSRSELIALAMDGPRQRLHLNVLGFHEKRHAAKEICDFLQHGLRNPFGKGKQSSTKERKNNESTDSVQKNINSAASHRTVARRRRAGPRNALVQG